MNQTEIQFQRYKMAIVEGFANKIKKKIRFSQEVYIFACSCMLSAFVRLHLEGIMPWTSIWQKPSLEIVIAISMVTAIGMGPLAFVSIYVERIQDRYLNGESHKI